MTTVKFFSRIIVSLSNYQSIIYYQAQLSIGHAAFQLLAPSHLLKAKMGSWVEHFTNKQVKLIGLLNLLVVQHS